MKGSTVMNRLNVNRFNIIEAPQHSVSVDFLLRFYVFRHLYVDEEE